MKKRIFSIMIAATLTLSLGMSTLFAMEGGIYTTVVETEPVVTDSEPANDIVTGTFETVPAGEGYSPVVYGSEDFVDGYEDIYSLENETQGYGKVIDGAEIFLRDRDVIAMVMPVIPDHMFDFTLDPGDLLSRYSSNAADYDPGSLYFKRLAGDYRYSQVSDEAVAVNKSSVPVLLCVSLQVENPDGMPVTYTDVNFVNDDLENNIGFSIVPVAVNELGEREVFIDREISIDETGHAELVMFLPGSEDNFIDIDGRLMPIEDPLWASGGFAIRGACNTFSDWGNVDNSDEIVIRVTYRMCELNQEQRDLMDLGIEPDPLTGVIDFDMFDEDDELTDDDDDDTDDEDTDDETTDDETTDDEDTDDETTDDETTNDETTNDETTDDEATDDGTADDALTDDGATDEALADDGLTGTEAASDVSDTSETGLNEADGTDVTSASADTTTDAIAASAAETVDATADVADFAAGDTPDTGTTEPVS